MAIIHMADSSGHILMALIRRLTGIQPFDVPAMQAVNVSV
jgi:hypothetical protein